jgi:hypothetical protein
VAGDVLTTSGEGSALVELKRGTRVKIPENSSVRFLPEGEAVRAELLSGGVVSESVGKPGIIVSTPKYQFAPAQEKECRYRVQLSREQAAVAAAMEGDVVIEARDAGGSYILREGTYAAIPPWAAGVPGQATEAVGQADPQGVGMVTDIIPDGVVQRKGQGAETVLKVNDRIYPEDVIRTFQNGRLRLALADGSSLSFGARSTMEFIGYDPRLQQTQIEFSAGEMHAQVPKLIQEYARFKVRTPTAEIDVVGADFIVEAQADKTAVYCIEGMVSVRNILPDIAEIFILHPGEYTSVASGSPPSLPMITPNSVLQSQISQTTVGPTAAEKRRAAPVGWHIGSLSEAESVGLVVGLAAGTAAAIAVPLITRGPTSASAP